jgi:hypothetical protein
MKLFAQKYARNPKVEKRLDDIVGGKGYKFGTVSFDKLQQSEQYRMLPRGNNTDEDFVEYLEDCISNGDVLPALIVIQLDNVFVHIQGYHTKEALSNKGYKEYYAYIITSATLDWKIPTQTTRDLATSLNRLNRHRPDKEDEYLQSAVESVEEGRLSVERAAKEYVIKYSSLKRELDYREKAKMLREKGCKDVNKLSKTAVLRVKKTVLPHLEETKLKTIIDVLKNLSSEDQEEGLLDFQKLNFSDESGFTRLKTRMKTRPKAIGNNLGKKPTKRAKQRSPILVEADNLRNIFEKAVSTASRFRTMLNGKALGQDIERAQNIKDLAEELEIQSRSVASEILTK